jgi:hypothetical protein
MAIVAPRAFELFKLLLVTPDRHQKEKLLALGWPAVADETRKQRQDRAIFQSP